MDKNRILFHKTNNLLHSILLLAGISLILAGLGWMLAGEQGIYWAFLLGVLFLIFSPKYSPRTLLKLYKGRPISPAEAPRLYAVAEALSEKAGLPRLPELFYVPSQVLNAFSMGSRDNSAVALTDGLIRSLTLRELSGVLAHEISHIQHGDVWVMGLADTAGRITSIFALLGQFLLFLNLPLILMGRYSIPWLLIIILMAAPSLSALLQLALSRTRELDADLEAAELTGDPAGLASALKKIGKSQGRLLERIFLPGRKEPHPSLLRTHPDTEERIRRLLSLLDEKEYQGTPHFLWEDAILPRDHLGFAPHSPKEPRWRPGGFWF